MQAECARHCRVIGIPERRAADAAAVVQFLVDPLDVPGRVVGDHEDRVASMACSRVDLHRVQSERAVAAHRHDLALRKRQRGRIRERHADAEASVGPRVEISGRREPETREAQDVAAIGDADGVVAQPLAQRGENAVGMHPAVPAGGRGAKGRLVLARTLGVLALQRFTPLGIDRGCPAYGPHPRASRASRQRPRQCLPRQDGCR